MINLTAKPTWQWTSKNAPAMSLGARTGNAGSGALTQILLPRSMDVNLSFALKYRR
jgi:hypothetical protein